MKRHSKQSQAGMPMPSDVNEEKTSPSESTSPGSTPPELPCARQDDAVETLDQELLTQQKLSWSRAMALACKRLQANLNKHLGRLTNSLKNTMI